MKLLRQVNQQKITRAEAVGILWNRGELSWKLHQTQKDIHNSIKTSDKDIIIVACSRRLGKSFLMCLLAIEQCLKNPFTIVKFVSPKQKQVKTNIRPIMNVIFKDCPPELRPDFKANDSMYLFQNGSEIQLAGTDNQNHENVRGSSADLCIVDEAGFCDELSYVVNSILLPTTTTTGGKVILVSTPSKSPDHEFITEFLLPAEFDNTLIKKTIYDNPLLTKTQVDKIIARYADKGGANSTEFRREYLAEVITEEDNAIVPEFNKTLQDRIVKEIPRPVHFDAYVSMDIGFDDLTVVLFAYYDFREDKIVIEDELVFNGPKMTTQALSESIKGKEAGLWTNKFTNEIKKPYIRVCDNNLILINDLFKLHQLTFMPTAKDNSEAALNNMRMYIGQERIIIHPRCQTLIKHLRGGTWNKSRTSYRRSPDSGHYDAIDALKYLVRNIQLGKNPFPQGYGFNKSDTWFTDSQHPAEKSEFHRHIASIYNIKVNK